MCRMKSQSSRNQLMKLKVYSNKVSIIICVDVTRITTVIHKMFQCSNKFIYTFVKKHKNNYNLTMVEEKTCLDLILIG